LEPADETPERFNIAAYALGRMAASKPDNVALMVFDGTSREPSDVWTYATLEDAVLRTTSGLQSLGIKMGDRVLLRMGNSVWFPIMFFACLAGGFVPVPTSDRLGTRELDHIAKDCKPILIAHDGATRLPSPVAGVKIFGPDDLQFLSQSPLGLYGRTYSYDPAYLIYTDGTSASPRGVLHAHRALWGRRQLQTEWLGLTQKDRILHTGADNWARSIGYGLMDPLCRGAAVILLSPPKLRRVFDQALPILVELTGATVVAAMPAHFITALKSGTVKADSMPSLTRAVSSGAILPAHVTQEWQSVTGRPIYDGYELAEIASPIYSGADCAVKPGKIGKPAPGRKLAILAPDAGLKNVSVNQIGVIATHRSDPALMLGYWNDAATTKAAVRGAWFLTGDLALRDQDGYIQYEGRLASLVNVEGYRANPEEIETIIAGLPSIREVAVAEGVVPGRGRGLVAYVVPQDGVTLAPNELNRSLAPLLVDYKRPKKWIEVDGLPKTASGKLARFALAEALAV
tara:strand:- start:27 stop:1571 length:1545 start_codon:yes stop_codon:yes gene_type:complete